MTRVSVAMAVYNGEAFLEAQLDSILSQLTDEDEVVVSINPSKDRSYEILEAYAKRDERIKLSVFQERGHLPNFNNALSQCKGEYIFLSDQDDIWAQNKLSRVMDVFEKTNALLLEHNSFLCDADCNAKSLLFGDRPVSLCYRANLIKPHYHGAAMAFRAALLAYALPIPKEALYHDLWLGLLAAYYGDAVYLNEPLLYFRRHGDNASVTRRRSLGVAARERCGEYKALRGRISELRRAGHTKGERL